MLGSGTPFVTYLYGADGIRVRKSNADGTFTEYVKFAGQPIAQKRRKWQLDGFHLCKWHDIGPGSWMDNRIHTHGVFTASDNELRWNLPTAPLNPDGHSYTVIKWRLLCFWVYNSSNAVGGPSAWFWVAGNLVSTAWSWSDTSGAIVNQWTTSGAWATGALTLQWAARQRAERFLWCLC